MNETAVIKVMTIKSNGDVTDAELAPGDVLGGLYREIDCELVDVVRLTDTLDMWVDDEGLVGADPVINQWAMVIAQSFGWNHQPYAGTVVLAEHDDDGNTVGLRPELRTAVRDLLGL